MTASTYRLSSWQFRALIASTLVATAGYLAFSVFGGWEDVLGAFARIGWFGTLIALGLSLVNYGLRFIRWQMYLSRLRHPVPSLPSLRIYLSGFALTTTPGKAGEAFRGVLLKQRGVPYPSSFAAFISERLSDLVAIILLALLGLSQYPPARGMVIIALLAVTGILLCLSSRTLLEDIFRRSSTRSGRTAQFISHTADMLRQARSCHSPGILVIATVISVIAWGAEAFALHCVLVWLGTDIEMSFAFFIYATAMLAGALSLLPGGLGGAEAVMTSLLILKGMPMPQAVAATVFIRLATLWFAVVIGMFAIWLSRKGEKS